MHSNSNVELTNFFLGCIIFNDQVCDLVPLNGNFERKNELNIDQSKVRK